MRIYGGVHVRAGRRQSMPSRSMESWAVERWIEPSVACGQMKRPVHVVIAAVAVDVEMDGKTLVAAPHGEFEPAFQ